MNLSIEPLSLLCILEYDLAEGSSVQPTFRVEYAIWSKVIYDCFEARGSWFYDLACEEISIDDWDAVLGEEGRDGRFARGDPSGKADDCATLVSLEEAARGSDSPNMAVRA